MSEIIRKRFAVYAVIQHTHVRISKTFVNLMKPEKYGKCSAVMLHTKKRLVFVNMEEKQWLNLISLSFMSYLHFQLCTNMPRQEIFNKHCVTRSNYTVGAQLWYLGILAIRNSFNQEKRNTQKGFSQTQVTLQEWRASNLGDVGKLYLKFVQTPLHYKNIHI